MKDEAEVTEMKERMYLFKRRQQEQVQQLKIIYHLNIRFMKVERCWTSIYSNEHLTKLAIESFSWTSHRTSLRITSRKCSFVYVSELKQTAELDNSVVFLIYMFIWCLLLKTWLCPVIIFTFDALVLQSVWSYLCLKQCLNALKIKLCAHICVPHPFVFIYFSYTLILYTLWKLGLSNVWPFVPSFYDSLFQSSLLVWTWKPLQI